MNVTVTTTTVKLPLLLFDFYFVRPGHSKVTFWKLFEQDFLQAGCPSFKFNTANSIKALKGAQLLQITNSKRDRI